jgi:4Fe-4S ferredoxin
MKRGVVSKHNLKGKTLLERKMIGLTQVLSMNLELCMGCGICVTTCPQEAAKLSLATIKNGRLVDKRIPDLDADKCTFCGECVVLCPSNALQTEINGRQTIQVVEANVFPSLLKKIDVDLKKCDLACKLTCQDSCPTKAVEVALEKEKNGDILRIQDVRVDTRLCIFCGKCEAVCSQNAIQVTKPFSGSLKFDSSLCPTGCQVCADVCPSKAISLNSNGNPVVEDLFCIYCGACIEACPKKAISLVRTRVLHTETTSGAWLAALEKLTSRPHMIKYLNSRTRRRLRETVQNIGLS